MPTRLETIPALLQSLIGGNKTMAETSHVVGGKYGEEAAWFDQLATDLYTAVVSDALDGLGYRNQAMTANIRPIWRSSTLIGRAHTLQSEDVDDVPPEPYEMEIRAVDALPPNHVIVASTNNSTRTCMWGELLSTASMGRGGRGAVIDGYTRDVAKIEKLGFPVFATGMKPVDSKGRGAIVTYGDPISCGGVDVRAGEIVIADIDGIAVIPQQGENDVIALAREKATGEHTMRNFLMEGRTLREAYDRFGIL